MPGASRTNRPGRIDRSDRSTDPLHEISLSLFHMTDSPRHRAHVQSLACPLCLSTSLRLSTMLLHPARPVPQTPSPESIGIAIGIGIAIAIGIGIAIDCDPKKIAEQEKGIRRVSGCRPAVCEVSFHWQDLIRSRILISTPATCRARPCISAWNERSSSGSREP